MLLIHILIFQDPQYIVFGHNISPNLTKRNSSFNRKGLSLSFFFHDSVVEHGLVLPKTVGFDQKWREEAFSEKKHVKQNRDFMQILFAFMPPPTLIIFVFELKDALISNLGKWVGNWSTWWKSTKASEEYTNTTQAGRSRDLKPQPLTCESPLFEIVALSQTLLAHKWLYETQELTNTFIFFSRIKYKNSLEKSEALWWMIKVKAGLNIEIHFKNTHFQDSTCLNT